MMKLLPFTVKPQIKTYLNYAYAFGIIEGNFGSNIIPRLICDSYVNCIYCQSNTNMFYIYSADSWYEKKGIISHESYVCKEANLKCILEALEIAKERLQKGEYIFCCPNEGYFIAKNNGKPYNFDHECLLWGIDYENRTFKSSNYINKIYSAYEIGFDELTNALINVQSGYVELLFFKANLNFKFEPLKVSNILELLDEYISSKCSEITTNSDLKKYIDSGKIKFGISAWDELIDYIDKVVQDEKSIDMRYIRSFLDHKHLMNLRLKYLAKNNYFSNPSLYTSKSEHILKIAKSILYISLKYEFTRDNNLLNKIIAKIRGINIVEREYIPELINELTKYISTN